MERSSFQVEVPGFLPTVAFHEAPPRERVVFTLTPGWRLTGRVAARNGAALADAEVVAEGAVAVRSGDEGEFELAVPTLPAQLTASAAGHRSASRTVRPARGGEAVELVLDPGQRVRGVLLDGSGLPLAAGEVWLERFRPPSTWSSSHHDLEIGDEGDFVLDVDSPGRYRLRIGAPGFRPWRHPEVEIAAGDLLDIGVVALERGAGVLGRLIDAGSAEPVAGAVVRLLPVGAAVLDALRFEGPAHATTDERGEFSVAGLDPGAYDLVIRHRDYPPSTRRVALEHPIPDDLGDLTLTVGARLSGAVRSREGAPRPAARIEVVPTEGEGLEPVASTTSDDEGRFSGLRLQPGSYRFLVRGQRLLLSQVVEVPEAEEKVEVDLVVGGTRVLGSVTERGEPVGGGFVSFVTELDPGLRTANVLLHTGGELGRSSRGMGLPDSHLLAEVNGAGRFVLDEAPPGPGLVEYFGADGDRVERRVMIPESTETEVRIELSGRRLSGAVVDGESGLGVAARIALRTARGTALASARTAEDGTFSIDGLEDGVLTLEASAEGYATGVVHPLTVGPKSPAAPLRIELDPGEPGALDLRLTSAAGYPAARVPVAVVNRAGHPERAVLTDPYGHLAVDHLAPGTYFVVWNDPMAGVGSSAAVEIRPGERTRLDEILEPGPVVRLFCPPERCAGERVDGLGLFSVEGIEIGAYLPGMASQLRFGAEGALPLGRVNPGTYLLRVSMAGTASDRLVSVEGRGDVLVRLP